MPLWIVAAALGSIAITTLLTFVLWRLNAPIRERAGNHQTAGVTAAEHGAELDGDAGSSAGSNGGGK